MKFHAPHIQWRNCWPFFKNHNLHCLRPGASGARTFLSDTPVRSNSRTPANLGCPYPPPSSSAANRNIRSGLAAVSKCARRFLTIKPIRVDVDKSRVAMLHGNGEQLLVGSMSCSLERTLYGRPSKIEPIRSDPPDISLDHGRYCGRGSRCGVRADAPEE